MTGVIWLDRPVVAGSPADRLVQLSGIPFRAAAPKVGYPFAHVTAQAVLSEELGDDVTALALTSRALNPRHVQLTSDIAEGEIGPGHESVERLDP